MKKCTFLLLSMSILIVGNISNAQISKKVTVGVDKPGALIQPTMWGVFFEDINFAADGGVYAELVKNCSFEFYKPLMGWELVKRGNASGDWSVIHRGELHTNNPSFLHIAAKAERGGYGFVNETFRGMGVKKDHQYRFRYWLDHFV